jgi:hypothetical protein
LRKNKDDELRQYFRKFKELDGVGLLTSLLAHELCFIERDIIHMADYKKVDAEAESLLLFLDKLRHKKRGEKVELNFEGSLIRFSLMPVGSAFTKIFGETPYTNRIKDRLKKGIHRIYLWGVGESNVKMIDKITKYKFEGTIVTRTKKEYYTGKLTVLPSVICRITMR